MRRRWISAAARRRLADQAPAALTARGPLSGGALRPAEGTRREKPHGQGPDPGPDATGAGDIRGTSGGDDRRPVRARAAALALPLAAAAAVSSCAPLLPTRLYTLVPAEVGAAQGGDEAPSGPTLGLDPVTLPAYLDRSEIVTRAGSHQVRLGEFDKWVEPLQPMFRRLLEERLREAAGAREVVTVPPPAGVAEPRHAVAVEVERFDADEAGRVVLDARWRVYRPATGRIVEAARERIVVQGAPPPDYPALVVAMGRAVGQLADVIASALPERPAGRDR